MSEEVGNQTLEMLRKAIERHLQEHVIRTREERNQMGYSIIQCYLMFQILDMLDNINTKIAMMDTDIQDVEQAVDRLNPDYK